MESLSLSVTTTHAELQLLPYRILSLKFWERLILNTFWIDLKIGGELITVIVKFPEIRNGIKVFVWPSI